MSDSEGGQIKMTDSEAVEKLHELQGDKWMSVCDSGKATVYTYDDDSGLWTNSKATFFKLCMDEQENLGRHGSMVAGAERVYKWAGCFNEVGAEWTRNLDKLSPGVVPFKDGLYDSNTQQIRPFQPDDYLTVKFDFNAPGPGELQSQEVVDAKEHIKDIFEQILPEEALYSNVLKELAQAFFEGKPEVGKFFVQHLGKTHSGKTTLFKIFVTVVPQWCAMLDPKHLLVDGKSSPVAAQSWKMALMGKRLVFCEEPKAGAKFDSAQLKGFRGGAPMTGRNLYEKNTTFDFQARIFIGTNSCIELHPPDKASIESLHVWNFPSQFVPVGDPRISGENVFPRDDNLVNLFKKRPYKLALFDLLVDHYDDYLQNGFGSEPPSQYDMRSIYEEEHGKTTHGKTTHGKTTAEFFNDHFIESRDDLNNPRLTRDLHRILELNGYTESEKNFGTFMKIKYGDRINQNWKHEFIKQVKKGGSWKWVGIGDKPAE
jgi:hypothetical protein